MSEIDKQNNQAEGSPSPDGHWNPELKARFTKFFGPEALEMAPTGPSMSVGQVRFMALPEKWERRMPGPMPAAAGLVEYHPPGMEYVRLNSFYRGKRISPPAGKYFHDILQAVPHALTSEEGQNLQEVFDDKRSEDFDVISARTAEWNGRKVLILKGKYKAEPVLGQTIYVDSDGTGTSVQELSFTAPEKLYDQFLPDADRSLKSIRWTANPG
jgi:hypothetical protein